MMTGQGWSNLAVCIASAAMLWLAQPAIAQDMVPASSTIETSSNLELKDVQDETPPAAAPPPNQSSEAILASVRTQLAEGKLKLSANSTAALAKFYSAAQREPLWTTDIGLTVRGQNIAKELSQAADHGLNAKDYRVAELEAEHSTSEQLASLEISLSAAVLRYARHAQGGRLSRKQAGSQLTHTPIVSPPEEILSELVEQDDPSFYLRSLHPRHPQFAELRAKLQEARGAGRSDRAFGPRRWDGVIA